MAISYKFPIRYKILALLSCMVIAAVAVYLYLASRVFYEDKTVLVYELNQNNVRTLAADYQAGVKRILDKLRLIAALTATKSGEENFSSAFAAEDELVKVVILTGDKEGTATERKFMKVWPEYLKAYNKEPEYLDTIRDSVPVPFEKVIEKGLWIRNATLDKEGSPPLMTVATAIEPQPGQPLSIIYADVRLDRMLESMSGGSIAETYLVDSEGKLLLSSDQKRLLGATDLTRDPLVQAGLSSQVRSQVRRFDEGEKSYLGSFFQTGMGNVLVASRTEVGVAFAAAERLIRKSLVFALLVITAAFLVALFFAHSLTRPIHRLLEATQLVGQGDFSRQIEVSSRDELATLAASFNSMTADLRASHEKIQEYSRDLENKVRDRTARLEAQNVAIKEAQEALVRTTRLASVGEIAGRAAHEVLNPLTNISARLEKVQSIGMRAETEDLKLLGEIVQAWSSELKSGGVSELMKSLLVPSTAQPGKTLLEEDLSNLELIATDSNRRLTERKSDVEFLLKESGRISKIVNGMRQLTRVSGNRRAVDINRVLEDALATMADVLAKNKIQTGLSLCEGDPKVIADSDELLQVFSNLLRNSMQAISEARQKGMPVGEPAKVWIESQLSNDEARGRRVLIRVCDNGPGIATHDFHAVFEASFTTKTAEHGTGLGLSIARRFIRALDGEIIVEKSEAGRETAFLIDLPEMQT